MIGIENVSFSAVGDRDIPEFRSARYGIKIVRSSVTFVRFPVTFAMLGVTFLVVLCNCLKHMLVRGVVFSIYMCFPI